MTDDNLSICHIVSDEQAYCLKNATHLKRKCDKSVCTLHG